MKNTANNTKMMPTACVLAFTLLGCTTIKDVVLTPTQFSNVERQIDLTVELNITNAFKEHVWHESFPDMFFTESDIYTSLDAVLADNAIAVAKEVFGNVIVMEEGLPDATSGSQGERQAVLTPRVADISRSPPTKSRAWAWTDVEQTVKIEWILKSPGNVVIWQGTGTGKFTNKNGNNFSSDDLDQERLQMAIDNAFKNSLEVLSRSPEIIAFAKQY